MIKKLAVVMVLVVSIFGVSSVEGAEIKGNVGNYPNETARNFTPNTDGKAYGTQVSWVTTAYFDGIRVEVTDSSGETVYSGVSGSAGSGKFSVSDLAIGTYTVTLIDERLTAVPFSREQINDPNTSLVLQDSMSVNVTIDSETDVKDLYWILVSKAKGVVGYSLHGEFPGGSLGVDQNGNPISYRTWY